MRVEHVDELVGDRCLASESRVNAIGAEEATRPAKVQLDALGLQFGRLIRTSTTRPNSVSSPTTGIFCFQAVSRMMRL